MQGFDANPPPRPQPHPNNNNNADANDENPQGDENIYNNDDDSNNEDANDINNDIVGGNDAANGVPVAAQAVAQNNMLNGARNNAPNRAQRNARGAAAAPAPPFNLVRWLNAVYHSGFTIPTTPGILMDVLSLFMGLFFSIVPAWVPYRL